MMQSLCNNYNYLPNGVCEHPIGEFFILGGKVHVSLKQHNL